jgi:hypothetical protein
VSLALAVKAKSDHGNYLYMASSEIRKINTVVRQVGGDWVAEVYLSEPHHHPIEVVQSGAARGAATKQAAVEAALDDLVGRLGATVELYREVVEAALSDPMSTVLAASG